ncbi:hypothetical protein [Verrucomicrobium spinosum]|nr:hypothetical protein [Verrucomicrobium spinosum]
MTDDDLSEFIEEFLEEKADLLPLIDLCDQGGSPEPYTAEFYNLHLTRYQTGEIEGEIDVSFTESFHGGCRDINLKERQSGLLVISIPAKSQQIIVRCRSANRYHK